MIKINLATRKQASLTSSAKTGLNLDVGSQLKDPIIRRTLLAVVVCFGSYLLLQDHQEKLLLEASSEVEALQAETARLKTEIAKLQEYETLKKSLSDDEQVIRTKLDVLRKLVAERTIPPKLLITLSESQTEDSWITAFKAADDEVLVSGAAVDFNRISDIIRRLSESSYLQDVTLKDSEQQVDRGSTVAFFELSAKRRK